MAMRRTGIRPLLRRCRPVLYPLDVVVIGLNQAMGQGGRVGNLQAESARIRPFLDFGVPTFIQLAACAALESSQDCVKEQCEIYKRRRDKIVDGLNNLGWKTDKPKGTMYLWIKLHEKFKKMGSMAVAEALIKETGVVLSPGTGFGEYGEGYLRMALVTPDNRLHDVLLRLKKFTNSR